MASAVLIALLAVMSWFVPGSGATLAFADIAEAIANVRTATWKTTIESDSATGSGTGMFLAPQHERMETTLQGKTAQGKPLALIEITDSQKNKALILDPGKKTALIASFENVGRENPGTFQGLRNMISEAQSGTKKGIIHFLGVETIDGRPAEGYCIQLGLIEYKIWADPTTSLPIRAEYRSEVPIGRETHFVMTDFHINVDLDEALFGLEPPAGYTVRQTTFNAPEPPKLDHSQNPWAPLAAGLKMAAEHNNGVFPPTLRGEQGVDGIMKRAAIARAEKLDKDSPDRAKVERELSITVGAALAMLDALPPEAWHYEGKGVKLGTPNRPILWSKQKDGNQCVVVYADSSVSVLDYAELNPRAASPEETPKLPESDGDPKP